MRQALDWNRTANDAPAWKRRVRCLDKRLESEYHSPRHGNPVDPTNELFFILLTRKTPWRRYIPVFRDLKRRYRPWGRLLQADLAELSALLSPLGISEMRAKELKQIAAILNRDFGSVSITTLRQMGNIEAKGYLTKLPGIGEKSARCVLMYSLGRDISPMDTHAIRVMSRFGLLPPKCDDVFAHKVVDNRLPAGMAYRLHVNIVAHGKETCKSMSPRCDKCCIQNLCPFSSNQGHLLSAHENA